MKSLRTSIMLFLFLCTLLFGQNSVQYDSIDADVVRSILAAIGWEKVPVDSVVGRSAAITMAAQSPRITVLNLSTRSNFPKITALPQTIGRLTELTTLLLNGNMLAALPESFSNLHKLGRLELSDNNFISVPPQLSELPLQILIMNDNKLTTLPAGIATMRSLQSASFRKNLLSSIPDSIAYCPNLKTLNLDSNLLASLPQIIIKNNLLSINVAGNRLCSVDSLLAAWLDKNRLTTDWRASQHCASPVFATITDANSGTVVQFSKEIDSKMVDCLPARFQAIDTSLFQRYTVLKIFSAVQLNFTECYATSFANDYFQLSFPLPGAMELQDKNGLSIYYAGGAAPEFLGGTINAAGTAISVRTGREGSYILALPRTRSIADKKRYPRIPALSLQATADGTAFIVSADRVTPAQIRIMRIDGSVVATSRHTLNAGTNRLLFGLSALSQQCLVVEIATPATCLRRTVSIIK